MTELNQEQIELVTGGVIVGTLTLGALAQACAEYAKQMAQEQSSQ
jgi:hypothetical protein